MHLAIPLTLYMGSFAAAAPSFQHAQISVEVTHTNFQNQADALHSSGKPVMNEDAPPFSHLPFNFTLIARNVHGTLRLPFGFADLTLADGLARGELGYATEFALHDRKLINGNRGLAYHEAKILPPWTSLWTFDKPHRYLEFAAIPNPSEKGEQYVLEFAASRKLTLVAYTQIFFIHSIFESANQSSLTESGNFRRRQVP